MPHLVTSPLPRERRAPFHVLLYVEPRDATRGGFFATSSNLSVSGMLLATSRSLPVDQKLRIRFVLPGVRRELAVAGRVVRREGPERFGIRFEGLDPRAVAHLGAVVARFESAPTAPTGPVIGQLSGSDRR